MQRRVLGNSGIEITPVVFGAWAIGEWMWGPQDDQDAIDAIHTALEHGLNAIDTAAIYGFGHSEELLGRALKGRNRDGVVILTKFGLRWDLETEPDTEPRFKTKTLDGKPVNVYRWARPESIIHECEQSLRRLKTDYIDVYQIHWPDPHTDIAETFGAVEQLIQQGKIRAAGVSNYDVEQMTQANNVVPLTSSQPPFSMVKRDAEQDVIPWCKEHNVGVVVYSPLQRGLLTGKFAPDHQFHEDDHRKSQALFQPESIRRVNGMLESLKPIAEKHNATLAQLVIAWTCHQSGITGALVGARNEKQARENAHAGEIRLDEEDLRTIREKVEALDLPDE